MNIQNIALATVLAVAPFAAFAESEADLATPSLMGTAEATMGSVMEAVSTTATEVVSETAATIENTAEVVEDTAAEHAEHAEHGMMKKAAEETEGVSESLKKSAY